MQIDKDVLQGLRDGRKLCGSCLGRKRVRVTVFGDFLGDGDYITYQVCRECGGSGLRPAPALSRS